MIIHNGEKGFMVRFYEANEGTLIENHFPEGEKGEPLIPTEKRAWELATQFASKMKNKCVDIYVINDVFLPVKNHKQFMIKNRFIKEV